MDVNNGNIVNPPPVVRQNVLDAVSEWREGNNEQRYLHIPSSCNRLEAIFVTGNLRKELPLESNDGNNPQTTTVLCLRGELSEEATDVFCGFLQETVCPLVSIWVALPRPRFQRTLQALQTNKSVKKVAFDDLQENSGDLVEELLSHKKDFISLEFFRCRSLRISDTLTRLLSGLMHLKRLVFYLCHIDDEGLRVILQGKYSFITELGLSDNQITSNGLGIVVRKIPEAFPCLERLGIAHNVELLNSPENTRLFTKDILPMLKQLYIHNCGDNSGYIQIIKACEAETIDKLEYLLLNSSSRSVRIQLIESLPKMKVKRLGCVEELFPPTDQALMSALYKNASILELFWIDNSITVASILQRNKILGNIKKYLLQGSNIITPLGRWSRILAEVGHERVRHGATPVYMILQAVLAQWVEPTQPSQLPQQMLEQQQQQQQQQQHSHDHDESHPLQGSTQPDSVFELLQQQEHDEETVHDMTMDDGPPTTAAAAESVESAMAAISSTLDQQPLGLLGCKRRAAPTTENTTTKKIKSDSI